MVELGLGRSRDDIRDRSGDSEDTEITLGTGKLLGIFFGLVLSCSIFCALGPRLGHSPAAGDRTEIVGTGSTSGSPARKPSAVNTNTEPPATTVGPAPASAAGNAPAPSTPPSAVPVACPAPS